jgi:hypothetical protein
MSLNTLALQISYLSHDSIPIITLHSKNKRLIKDTPTIYLQQHVQITLNPLGPSRGCLSLVTSSVPFLSGFIFASSHLVVCQTRVENSWRIVFCMLSGIPSLLVFSNSKSFKFGRPLKKPQILEYRRFSLLVPLWFKHRPSLPKVPMLNPNC